MEVLCPVCKSTQTKSTTKISRDSTAIQLIQCHHCTHRWQDPKNYQDIYSTGKFTEIARDAQPGPTPSKIKQLDKAARNRAIFYQDLLKEMDNILEVGSSIGSFLHVLKLMGKKVHGIEPDPVYAAYSEIQYALHQDATLLEAYNPSQSFDAICNFHVIEHVKDPDIFLRKAYDLLNDSGKLLIECPSWEIHSYGSVKHTIWEPHIHYFSLASMYHLVSKYFNIIRLGYYGIGLYVFAEKSPKSTFSLTQLKKLKSKSKWVYRANSWLPNIPLVKHPSLLSSKQLYLQPMLQQTMKTSGKKLVQYSKFAIREFIYRRKERGRGKAEATHLSYFSGWENAGDTVLSKCVRDTFNTANDITWRLRKVTDKVDRRLISEINRSSFLLIGGGGLLLPDSNPNSKSGWQWAASKQDIAEIEVPIVIFAIGYNYFPGQTPNDFFIENLRHIIDRADFFGIRNHGSIDQIVALLGETYRDKITYQPCPTTIIRKLHPQIEKKKKTKNIAVNIAYDRYKNRFGEDIYVVLDQIAQALKALERQGYKIFNACHLEEDAKFELSLNKRQVSYQTVQLQYQLPEEVYHFYNEMDLVLGMRGHAQMIPFGLNCKILSLGSHNKLRYFLEDIDAGEWFIDLRKQPDNLAQEIIHKVEQLYIQEDLVAHRIELAQQKLYDCTKVNINHIAKLVHS